jgi:hypothetical protein
MTLSLIQQSRRLSARMPAALVGSLCLALFGCESREAAAIDLPQRQVTTKDLPAIP